MQEKVNLQKCNQTFLGKITFIQFRARVLKAIAQKNGQRLEFTTLDDLKHDLKPEFLQKSNALLGKYLDTKKNFYKEGHAPIECYNIDKLREIENVPMMPRCFRSIIPNKPHKRTKSAVPFGCTLPKQKGVSQSPRAVQHQPPQQSSLSSLPKDSTAAAEVLYGKFIDKLKQLKDEGFQPTEWFDAEMQTIVEQVPLIQKGIFQLDSHVSKRPQLAGGDEWKKQLGREAVNRSATFERNRIRLSVSHKGVARSKSPTKHHSRQPLQLESGDQQRFSAGDQKLEQDKAIV